MALKVSEEFVKIFTNFNVCRQTEKMKQLPRKELLLLLTLAVDSFNEDNPMVLENFTDFKNELEIIYSSLPNLTDEDVIVTDSDLIELGNDTGDKTIDSSNITDITGSPLPKPLTDEEAVIKRRQVGIDNIIN